MGIEGVILKHHGDIAVFWGDIVHEDAIDVNLAGGDFLETGDHPQGRRFATARRTDEHDEFLILYLEAHVVDGDHILVEHLGD